MTSLALASLTAGSLIILGAATAQAQDHTDWALDFITNSGPNNEWGSPCQIDWSVPSGVTKGACFFALTLMQAQGYTEEDIDALWGARSPSSDTLYQLIYNSLPIGSTATPTTETYFRRVSRAIDIEKGDILSIGATGTYSGHTMIITGAAIDISSQGIMPRYSGTKQYALPIADSTNTSHGCNAAYPDSRWRGPCTGGYVDPGAGTAYLRVYTDSLTGILLGFTWSVTASTSSYYSPSTRPYRIGRLFKLPDDPAPTPDTPEDPPPPP